MAGAQPADTLIYLDIDGVLNVGVRDGGNAPLLFNEENCRRALAIKDPTALVQAERDCVEKMVSVAHRSPGVGERGTFVELACVARQECSEILLSRLAAIIRAAGPSVSVVLASNWRKPKYASKVARLERDIARHLGSDFMFDACTPVVNEASASDRLLCIGTHLWNACKETKGQPPLRVLVLDDFFVSPFDGWTCQRSQIACSADVETYLSSLCAGSRSREVSVKMVHCYEEWTTSRGLWVQVGTGLTMRFVGEAMEFLGHGQGLGRKESGSISCKKEVGSSRWGSIPSIVSV